MSPAASLLCLTLVSSAFSAADSAGWDRFRRYQGAGVAAANGAPEELSLENTLLWKKLLPSGKSSTVLAGNRFFLTAWRGDQRIVLCLDRHNGKLLWERSISKKTSQPMNKLNDAASPSPATDGQNVYAFLADAGLVYYDASGKHRWHKPLGPFSSVHGIGTSPIVSSGLVVVAIEQQAGGSSLTAFDANTGAPGWKMDFDETGQQGYGTPLIYPSADGSSQVVYSRPGEIGAWSLATGLYGGCVARAHRPIRRPPSVRAFSTLQPMATLSKERCRRGTVSKEDQPIERANAARQRRLDR